MHELRYSQEVYALSQNIYVLWLLKCRYIVDGSFQEPSALKIYFQGREIWLFDYLPTMEQASRDLAESALPQFECSKIIKKERLFYDLLSL